MEPYRVVIVEDDVESATQIKTLLENDLGCAVLVSDPTRLLTDASRLKADVVISGTAALRSVAELRLQQSRMPIIVMTTEASVDNAVRALRSGANEYLTRSAAPVELAGHVSRLADTFRATSSTVRKRQVVLAVGAHPDDVEVGVGGILAAHAAHGDDVTIVTLSKGRRDGGSRTAWEEGAASAATIGARLIFEDQVEGSESIIAVMKRLVAEINPTIVYVHSKNDRRQDHRLVHEATVAATEEVRTVACYQGTTGTIDFAPTRFAPIDGFTDAKLAMLACFAARGERPSYLAPDFVLGAARYWSQFGQGTWCEPLEIIRESILSPVAQVLVAAAA